jgi:hypothetical protein
VVASSFPSPHYQACSWHRVGVIAAGERIRARAMDLV